MKNVILIISAIMGAWSCMSNEPVDTEPVDTLVTEQYMGVWYEIARLDHPFERGMERVEARYSLRPDGRVKVVNSGYRNEKYKQTEGVAKLTDRDGVLKVKFFLFYAPYIVMELDQDNYYYALVGSSSPKYLWILSRTPQLPPQTLDMLLESARRRGYDTSKLIFPQHEE